MTGSDDSSSSGFLKEVIKHGKTVFLGRVTQLGIQFAATILLARYLGQTGFGSISLALSVMVIGSTLSIAGLNTGVARFLPRYDDPTEKAALVGTAGKIVFFLSFIIAATIYLGTFLIKFGLRQDDLEVIRVLTVGIPVFAAVKLIWGVFQGQKLSRDFSLTKQILFPIFRLLLLVIATLTGLGILGLAYAQVTAYVLVFAVSMYFLYKHSREVFEQSFSFDFDKGKELLLFSSPLVIAGAMNMVMSHTDTIFIGILADTSSVGIYNTVYPLAMLMFVIQGSLGFIFLPSLSERHTKGIEENVKESYLQVVTITAVLTFPAFFIFVFSPNLVLTIIFGKEYATGDLALIVLSMGFYLRAILGPNNPALKAIGKTKKVMFIDVFAASTNIVLNVLLIPEYGFLGAAIATSISYVLMGVLYSASLYRNSGIHPISGKTIIIASLSLIVPFIVRIATESLKLENNIISVAGVTLLVVVVYIFLLEWLGLFRMQELVAKMMTN